MTCAAAATDVRSRRIPNALTGFAALAAVAVHAPAGLGPVALSLAAMAGAFLLGSVAFSAGWFGGGDVKLLAGCCGLAGIPGAPSLALDVLVAGALLALATALAQGRLVTLVRSTAAVAAHGAPSSGTTLPYAVAIAAGTAFYVFSPIAALRLPL
ncbi:MAG TPA: A24 family peptidase [Candidatus Elarobacter sp.]